MGLKGNQNGIIYHIDEIRTEGSKVILKGFASAKSHDTVNYTLRDSAHCAYPAKQVVINTCSRVDISQMLYGSDEWGDCGFEIRISMPDGIERFELEMNAGAFCERTMVNPNGFVTSLKQKRAQKRFERANKDYKKYREQFYLYPEHIKAQREEAFSYMPKLSLVIPVYEPELKFLKQMIDSVVRQSYEKWEICVACGTKGNIALSQLLRKYKTEDPRFDFRLLEENEGIAGNTNRAMEMASGDVILFADQDDLLAPDAFYQVVRYFNKYPDADLVYSDEDKVNMDGTVYYEPHFKTDYNPDLLYTNNYISHLCAMKASLTQKIGKLDPSMDGAQDYDYILRACEQAARVVHIPKVLYHWRNHPGSTAGDASRKEYCALAAKRALEAHIERCHIPAIVSDRLNQDGYFEPEFHFARDQRPLISVVFTGAGKIKRMDELQTKADFLMYEPVEVLLAGKSGISNKPKGEYILFLNAETKITDSTCLFKLLGILERPDVAAAGGCILSEQDQTISQMGMIFKNGEVYPMFAGCSAKEPAYCNRNRLMQDVSILSLDFMLVKTADYEAVGGLAKMTDPKTQAIDLSLKLRKAGRRLVTMPGAVLHRDLSTVAVCVSEDSVAEAPNDKTEGAEVEKASEHDQTAQIMEAWKEVLHGTDPYFSKGLKVLPDGSWGLCLDVK